MIAQSNIPMIKQHWTWVFKNLILDSGFVISMCNFASVSFLDFFCLYNNQLQLGLLSHCLKSQILYFFGIYVSLIRHFPINIADVKNETLQHLPKSINHLAAWENQAQLGSSKSYLTCSNKESALPPQSCMLLWNVCLRGPILLNICVCLHMLL